jgi:hypothetical protein
MKTRTLIFMSIFLFLLVICSKASGQNATTANEALYGTWISPKWDSPPKSNFVPNEGFGKIVFSAEAVWFYRKSSDVNDVGTDSYRMIDKFSDQNENTFFHIVFFEKSDIIGNPPWYYIFKASDSANTLEYLCSYYDQSAIWDDLKKGVFTDWYLYKSSGSNQYDIMYRD